MQQTMFETVNGKVVVNNFSDPSGESETTPTTVKFKDSMKAELRDFCFSHDLSLSEYLRNAAIFYRQFYDQETKLKKYQKAVIALLEGLP